MSLYAGLSPGAWVVIGVVAAIVIAGTIVALTVGRRALTRRYLVALIGRLENVRASRRTLEAVMRHLVDESDEALVEFAENPASVDRRALAEVRDGMLVVVDEMDTRPLPGRLIRVAEELADAAFVIAEESGRIRDNLRADEVLTALAEIDLSRVAKQVDEANVWIDEACAEYEIEDTAVYGGGLYI